MLKVWAEEEIAYLEKYAGIKPTTQIAKRLGRTDKSVRQKASRLGLTMELELDNFSAASMASFLGVTEGAVRRWIDLGYLKASRRRMESRGWLCISLLDFRRFYRKYCLILPSLAKVERENLQWLMEKKV
jgi:hypothetical protein